MEKDDEIKGSGNSYDFGARMLDPRLGRWLTIDPLFKNQPDQSPYKAFYNSPLVFLDPDGKDEFLSIVIVDKKGNKATIRYPDLISNKLRAGGVHSQAPPSLYKYQKYYDFRTVITVTMDENGALDWANATSVPHTLKDQKRKTVSMFSSTISSVPEGAIVDPDASGWDLTGSGGTQQGGVTYTSSTGGASATKFRPLTPTEEHDIETFLYYFHAGRGLNYGSVGFKDAINDLKGITEEVKMREDNKPLPKSADENVGVQSSRNIPKAPTNSNVVTWRRPKGSYGSNTGSYTEATPEQKAKGDTMGGNPTINKYPKK